MSTSTRTYTGGKLDSLSTIRIKLYQYASKISASARQVVPREESIPVLYTGNDKPTSTDFSLALAYCISRFYSETGHHDINPGRLACSAAGIIANMTRYDALTPWKAMKDAFLEADIRSVIKRCTPAEYHVLAEQDERMKEFLALFGEEIGYVLEDTPAMIVLRSVILLGSVKNITPQNYAGWIKNRVKGFSGTAGWADLITIITPQVYPLLATMSAYNSFCSANFDMRRQLFLTILAVSVGTFKNNITLCCGEIINLMRGSEINHLILIDRTIFNKHIELSHLSCMKGLRTVMGDAMQYLMSLPPEDVMFVRILYDKDHTALLNRNRFDLYATVATAVAQYENSTFDSYYISETESHQRIASLVKRYLSTRDKLLQISAGEREVANMTPTETDALIKKALEQFDREMITTVQEMAKANIIELPGGKYSLLSD